MPSKKAAPKTRNLTRHVSLYLNLEKPVPTVAFQEKIEDVAHLPRLNGFLVSKEIVVLRRWGRLKQKFGFIKRVDKG